MTQIYDEFVDFIIVQVSPEAILAFRPSEAAQIRAEELLERNNAGTLTDDEADELQQMFQLERLVSALKARALGAL